MRSWPLSFFFFLSFTSLLNQKHSFPLAVFRFASECVHVVVKWTPSSCIRFEKSELDQEQLQTAETSEAQAAGGPRRDWDPASCSQGYSPPRLPAASPRGFSQSKKLDRKGGAYGAKSSCIAWATRTGGGGRMRSLRKAATLEQAQGALTHRRYAGCWSCSWPGFRHVAVVQEAEVELQSRWRRCVGAGRRDAWPILENW